MIKSQYKGVVVPMHTKGDATKNMTQNIHPLILCGGIGTRLWPLSRTEHPKQFQRIDSSSHTTFFQSTVDRQRIAGFENPIVAVSAAHTATAQRQLDEISCPANIIAEPVARNTGPAVLAAALKIAESDPEGLLCVLPSDHIVKGSIASQILEMRYLALTGKIVLFGIRPEYPEPGFGYIMRGERLEGQADSYAVTRFVEKPTADVALDLITHGNALWASGISLFRVDVLIAEFKRFDPDTFAAVEQAFLKARHTNGVLHLNAQAFAKAASLPTEMIVFEQSTTTAVTPLNVAWSDVGAWNALHHIGEKNEEGNVLNGDVVCTNTRNSYIRSSGRLVTVIGLENMIIVDTDDALLVTTREQAHEVKQLVNRLVKLERREVAQHVRDQQMWGEVHSIQKGAGYELRVMKLRAGSALTIAHPGSSHRLMTVAQGSGLLKTDTITRPLMVGDSFEVAAEETAIVFNGAEAEMQLVEIICDLPVRSPGRRVLVNSLVTG
jgi:mannose-1-phosphate guanylyltransferase / mannose-6-phosphate isomerase